MFTHMTIQTVSPQFKVDQKLLDYIQDKLAKLAQVFDRIIDCSVTLRLESHHQVRDKVAEVKLHVPGATLVATESQRTFEAAVDLLVDKLRRQLTRYKRRRSSGALA